MSTKWVELVYGADESSSRAGMLLAVSFRADRLVCEAPRAWTCDLRLKRVLLLARRAASPWRLAESFAVLFFFMLGLLLLSATPGS